METYAYANHRDWLNTPDGIKSVGEVMDKISSRLDPAGCATMLALMPRTPSSSWDMLAAVDRCVEMGVLVEVEQKHRPAGQYRIFMRPRRD